jgi:hypothetical protein
VNWTTARVIAVLAAIAYCIGVSSGAPRLATIKFIYLGQDAARCRYGKRSRFRAFARPHSFLISLLSFALLSASAFAASNFSVKSSATDATPQYLLFHIFNGTVDPTTGVYFENQSASDILGIAQTIASTVRPSSTAPNRILGIDIGPISPDLGATVATSVINAAFNVALSTNLAVAIHLDDRMFWKNATFPNGSSLLATPGTTEWTDWNGDPAPPLVINWLTVNALAPQMCYASPPVQSWTQYWLLNVIGPAVVAGYQQLIAVGKPQLFAGIFAGWEANVVYGYCSLSYLGYSASNPPENFNATVEQQVLQPHISLWAQYLAQASIPSSLIYTHEAWPTINPQVAFNSYSQTGWTNYNWPSSFEQIYSTVGSARWVQAEGSNVTLGNCPDLACPSPYDWETYLAASYNHGASLVTIFNAFQGYPDGWQTATGAQAIAAYQKFLRGATLVEHDPIP